MALPRLKDDPLRKFVSPLTFELKHFPHSVFVSSPLKFLLPRQNYTGSIVDNSLKFHFPVMIFLTPLKKYVFRNFPAVFSVSGRVVAGGCTDIFPSSVLATFS